MNNEKIQRIIFIIITGLTLFNLYKDIIWLSAVLAAAFIVMIVVYINKYKKAENKSKKTFVQSLIILIVLCLTNAVVVIANYVYPY